MFQWMNEDEGVNEWMSLFDFCRPKLCNSDLRIIDLLTSNHSCGIDGRTVYLKKSYWGEVENDRLATYWCPYQFCHCKSDGDLPGCKFDSDREDGQCAHNRTGILCGRCKKNFSVGLNIALNLGFSLGLERWHFNLMAFQHILFDLHNCVLTS